MSILVFLVLSQKLLNVFSILFSKDWQGAFLFLYRVQTFFKNACERIMISICFCTFIDIIYIYSFNHIGEGRKCVNTRKIINSGICGICTEESQTLTTNYCAHYQMQVYSKIVRKILGNYTKLILIYFYFKTHFCYYSAIPQKCQPQHDNFKVLP